VTTVPIAPVACRVALCAVGAALAGSAHADADTPVAMAAAIKRARLLVLVI
jgi:hypothetical protein